MIHIKISTAYGGKPFIKQAPHLVPEWKNCIFHINEDVSECDFWVVYGGLGKEEKTICPKENTIFITNEPPSVKKYKKEFTDQFGAIITCHKNIKHPNVIHAQQVLPWWVGHKLHSDFKDGPIEYFKTYDELKTIQAVPKSKVLSVIASNKKFTSGHRKRYDFVQKLKAHFGDKIDVFGTGEREIEDKWDAIAPYKYTIVIENSSLNDYWTEKLSDAFLGLSYPIYSGCPNIHDYFSPESLTSIDCSRPSEAIAKIEKVIQDDTYEKELPSLYEAKSLILDKYQIFPMLADFCSSRYTYQQEALKEEVSLIPESQKSTVWEQIADLPRRVRNKLS